MIAVIAVLLAILFPMLRRSREAGRRARCMANLHQIQIGWQAYATDHGDYIVNGQPWRLTLEENPGLPWMVGEGQPDGAQTAAQAETLMRKGALARYVGDVRAYLCPARYRRVWSKPGYGGRALFSSYGIVVSMNVVPRELWAAQDREIRASHNIGRAVLFVTKTSEILEPGPSSRMVFLDLGSSLWWGESLWGGGSYWYGWHGGLWAAGIQHSNGTCMSFADGHVEYWKWKDPRTLADVQSVMDWFDQRAAGVSPAGIVEAPSEPPNEDYIRLHTAIWGKGPK